MFAIVCYFFVFQRYLASVIDEMDDAWRSRHDEANALPHVFGPTVTGCIDTFPIIINRPALGNDQRFFYNGKYANHIVKVSLRV